jgi:hypothetical protein
MQLEIERVTRSNICFAIGCHLWKVSDISYEISLLKFESMYGRSRFLALAELDYGVCDKFFKVQNVL